MTVQWLWHGTGSEKSCVLLLTLALLLTCCATLSKSLHLSFLFSLVYCKFFGLGTVPHVFVQFPAQRSSFSGLLGAPVIQIIRRNHLLLIVSVGTSRRKYLHFLLSVQCLLLSLHLALLKDHANICCQVHFISYAFVPSQLGSTFHSRTTVAAVYVSFFPVFSLLSPFLWVWSSIYYPSSFLSIQQEMRHSLSSHSHPWQVASHCAGWMWKSYGSAYSTLLHPTSGALCTSEQHLNSSPVPQFCSVLTWATGGRWGLLTPFPSSLHNMLGPDRIQPQMT